MKRLYGIKCKLCTRAAIFVLAALAFLSPSLSHSPTLPASALSAAATCVCGFCCSFLFDFFSSSLASSVFAKRKSQKVYATSRATKQSQKRQVSLASLSSSLPLSLLSLSPLLALSSPTCSCFQLCCQPNLFPLKSSFFHSSISHLNVIIALTSFFNAET